MKKAQIQVVSVILILLVLATSSVVLFKWTQEFSNDLQTKNIQNPRLVGKDIKVIGLEQKNGVLNAVIRSPIAGYKQIEKATLNGENCSLLGTNVITGQSISIVPLDCPTLKDINNLIIYTKYNIIEKSDSITVTNTYLSCTGPDLSTIPHLASKTFYATDVAPFGSSCISEQRVCDNGILSGSYNAINCIVSTVFGNDADTKLLIQSDSSYLSQEFIDSSNSSKNFSKFGPSYGFIDGIDDYILVPHSTDFNLNSGDFTIDGWIYIAKPASSGYIISKGKLNVDNSWFLYVTDTQIQLRRRTTGSDQDVPIRAEGLPSLTGEWFHFAITKQGNDYKTYRNGVLVGQATTTSAVYSNTAELMIGGRDVGFYYSNNIMIDDLRISNGIVRWNTNFIPPEDVSADANTDLLLKFDGGEGNTTFIDSSSPPHTLNTFGDIKQTDLKPVIANGDVNHYQFYDKKIGPSSAYFDGTGDYLSIPDSEDWDFGTEDFTIDFWTNFAELDTTIGIMGRDDYDSANYGYTIHKLDTNEIRAYIEGSGCDSAQKVDKNIWYHIALTRNNDNVKLFINGKEECSFTFTGEITKNGNPLLSIGSYYYTGGPSRTYHKGYLDELRISKGIARWISEFTPPTSEYTSDEYTKLLLHFDQGMDSPNFIDSGSSGHQITKTGDTNIISTHPFSNIIGTFDGTGDYLTIPDSEDFNFGTDDFTIDFWMKEDQLATHGLISQWYAGAQKGWEIMSSSGNALTFWWSSDGSDEFYLTSYDKPEINTWNHYAIVRNENEISIYINGIKSNSTTTASAINHISIPLEIGKQTHTNPAAYYPLKGNLDELRISKGIARWTTNFTVPTSEYSSDTDTKLLLHFNNEGTTFTDSSDSSHTITTNGDSNQINLDGKINSYISFDGSGDYISIPTSPDFNFGTNDFTVETWIKRNSISNAREFFAGQTNSAGNTEEIMLGINPDNTIYAYNRLAFTVTSTSTVTDTNWHHVAIVRDGNLVKLYLDGTQEASQDIGSTSLFNDPTSNFALGIGGEYISAYDYNGALDEFRLSKGIARYSSDFTPQTTPFETDEYTKLLLHFEDFEDSSKRGHTLTVQGDTKQSGTQLNNDFTGYFVNESYLRIPHTSDWDFGSEDFTIDGWIKLDSSGTHTEDTIISKHLRQNEIIYEYSWMLNQVSGQIGFLYSTDGSSWKNGRWTTGIPNDKWTHFAIVRNGVNLDLYINGIKQSGTQNIGSDIIYSYGNDLLIGTYDYLDGTDNTNLEGMIEELRISKGIARWTENFIPENKPYQSDEYTSLLLHFDPETNYTHFVDSSSNNHQITKYGDATIKRKYPFNGSAMYFDGTGDYLTLPDSQNWNFGTENFTIDLWYYPTELVEETIFDQYVDNNNRVLLYFNPTNLVFRVISGGTSISDFSAPSKLKLNTWHHIAAVRNDNEIYFYTNGELIGSSSIGTYPDYNATLLIGANRYNSGLWAYLNGYIDEYRISKGIVRWNDSFIPPSQPYK